MHITVTIAVNAHLIHMKWLRQLSFPELYKRWRKMLISLMELYATWVEVIISPPLSPLPRGSLHAAATALPRQSRQTMDQVKFQQAKVSLTDRTAESIE